MSNFLEDELTHAESIIAKSKTVISDLLATIESHEKTIASHVSTISDLTSAASVAESVVTGFHAKFSEFESFLGNLGKTIERDLGLAAPEIASLATHVSDVANTVAVDATYVATVANTVADAAEVVKTDAAEVANAEANGSVSGFIANVVDTIEHVIITPFK